MVDQTKAGTFERINLIVLSDDYSPLRLPAAKHWKELYLSVESSNAKALIGDTVNWN